MARRQSAGILLHRLRNGAPEVLLGHPGGPFWVRKDEGAWTIPKGEFEPGEDAKAAALREFREETGFPLEGELVPLAPLRQPGGKLIEAYACAGDCDPERLRSKTFTMEWPRGSGKLQEYPELDRAGWFGLPEARRKILPGQAGFLDELAALLSTRRQEHEQS